MFCNISSREMASIMQWTERSFDDESLMTASTSGVPWDSAPQPPANARAALRAQRRAFLCQLERCEEGAPAASQNRFGRRCNLLLGLQALADADQSCPSHVARSAEIVFKVSSLQSQPSAIEQPFVCILLSRNSECSSFLKFSSAYLKLTVITNKQCLKIQRARTLLFHFGPNFCVDCAA